jgi:hypothetical protein
LTHFVNGVGELRSGNGSILKCTNYRAIHERIRQSRRASFGQFTSRLHRSVDWGRVNHIGLGEEITNILGLSKQQRTIGEMINLNSQKIIKVTKLLERKRLVKLLDDRVKESRVVAGDDDVIYIHKQIDSVALTKQESAEKTK